MSSDKRIQLHNELTSIVKHCYFQPPESVKLIYPCIVYELEDIDVNYANNDKYLKCRRYSLTLIGKDPDTEYIDKILDNFKYCRFDREYIVDGLIHDTFDLYY